MNAPRTPMRSALLVGAILLGACGSSTDGDIVAPLAEEAPGSTAPERSGRTTELTVDLAQVESDLDEDELRNVVEFYQEFLWLRDEALLAAPGDDLARVVTEDVLARTEQERTTNDDLLAKGDVLGVQSRTSYTHVTRVDGPLSDVILADCVEQEEVNALGQRITRYVEQTVEIGLVDGLMTVEAIDITNEGRLGEAPGCLPNELLRRAERAAGVYLTEVAVARADPSGSLPEPLASVVGDPLRGQIEQALADQLEVGVVLTTPEEHRFAAVGRDVSQAGTVVVVSTCTHLPEGRAFASMADGEPIELGLEMEAGSAIAADLFVKLGSADGPGDQVFSFANAESFSACWEEGP